MYNLITPKCNGYFENSRLGNNNRAKKTAAKLNLTKTLWLYGPIQPQSGQGFQNTN